MMFLVFLFPVIVVYHPRRNVMYFLLSPGTFVYISISECVILGDV